MIGKISKRKPVIRQPQCPKCGTTGHNPGAYIDEAAQTYVVGHEIIRLACRKCKTKWRSIAGKCPICGNYNGFSTDGSCTQCFEDGKPRGANET